MSTARNSPKRLRPPPQDNLARATELAFAGLAGAPEEQLVWLGAARREAMWRLPVLNDVFHVDLSDKRITTFDGGPVGSVWAILVLHYLAVSSRPETRPPQTTFADLAAARSYAGVYQGRVIGRLCHTAGRSAETLRAAAVSLGGEPAEGGDAAYLFRVFPRVVLRLIWHAPDEEFRCSATLLLPDNIESYFCCEDIVVLSESLVARLGGRPF
ncbi:MAG: DUF3786 domain-containing protein [Pirellulales bacterium]|nr:DUF3786 domain-containing protein [Pirellulales bacterium]